MEEPPESKERLVGVCCSICGEPLIFVNGSVPSRTEPQCPRCWQQIVVAHALSTSIRVAMASGELEAVMRKIQRQRNRVVLQELSEVRAALTKLSEHLAEFAWASQ